MTVDKIISPIGPNELITKTNEIIDALGEGITVDQTYDSSSTNAQSGVAVSEAIASKTQVIFRAWS